MDKQQEAGTGGKSGIAWLSLLALPVIAVVLLFAAVLFYQPIILDPLGFQVWAARPWLMQPIAVAMGVLALLALFRLPWRRRSPQTTWGMLPAALILLLACGVGYGGATLSYGATPYTLNYWQLAYLNSLSTNMTASAMSSLYARECINEHLSGLPDDNAAGVTDFERYRSVVQSNCACPTANAADSIALWMQRDQALTRGDLALDWRVVDCEHIALDVSFNSAAACAYLIYRRVDALDIRLQRGEVALDPASNPDGIREFCYRDDLPDAFSMIHPVRTLS
ncbi:MAG: hypothetical protein CL558_00465 [Alphaproteobacteria bacterium]|nr:hypothetical protein [Alphaproteobacteria bacterium]MAS47666.1 hypothetical protein [Alphaproteobacteria bacterium]MBN52027.1 hypothetical protein [Alphaproteobacteria bacterium]OUT40854.1 MAG: hypothetical protein CBB62_00330 [Micavibrio sp. TMED2]